jgi:hypothetical protein
MITEDREINGEEIDQETVQIRDERGRFIPGSPGGPGRRKSDKKSELEAIENLLELLEQVAKREVIEAKDLKGRLDAAKVALKVEVLKKAEEDKKPKPVMSPIMRELIRVHLLSPNFGGLEGLERMSKTCLNCENFPGDRELNMYGSLAEINKRMGFDDRDDQGVGGEQTREGK